MKQIEVQIMGQSYLLGCPEGGEVRLREAVERVDTAMCSIRDGGKVRARDRIAVLAALNLAFDQPASPAPTVTPPAAGESLPTATAGLDDAGQVARMHRLLQRLDAVLGDDGRLI